MLTRYQNLSLQGTVQITKEILSIPVILTTVWYNPEYLSDKLREWNDNKRRCYGICTSACSVSDPCIWVSEKEVLFSFSESSTPYNFWQGPET